MIEPPSLLLAAAAAVVNSGLGLGERLELRLVELSIAAVLMVSLGVCLAPLLVELDCFIVEEAAAAGGGETVLGDGEGDEAMVDEVTGVDTVAVSTLDVVRGPVALTLLSMRSEASHESGFSLL